MSNQSIVIVKEKFDQLENITEVEGFPPRRIFGYKVHIEYSRRYNEPRSMDKLIDFIDSEYHKFLTGVIIATINNKYNTDRLDIKDTKLKIIIDTENG